MGSWQKGICSLEPSRGNFDYSRSSPLVLTEAPLFSSVLVLTVAAELAVQREDVKGPGTFLSGLIDTLWALSSDDVQNLAKVSIE